MAVVVLDIVTMAAMVDWAAAAVVPLEVAELVMVPPD